MHLIARVSFIIGIIASLNAHSWQSCENVWQSKPSVFAQMMSYGRVTMVGNQVPVASYQTSFFLGHVTDQQVQLITDPKKPFESVFETYGPGTNTPQSDIRIPLALFGESLSRFFGFDFLINEAGHFIVSAPTPKLIQERVFQLNSVLPSEHQIAYLPQWAPYITEVNLLKFSLSPLKNIEMVFPYNYLEPKLLPHEVTFHIMAMLFPRDILKRARVVTERTLQMIQILRGKGFDALAEVVAISRTDSLDFGTAVPLSLVGKMLIQTGSQAVDSAKSIEYLTRQKASSLSALSIIETELSDLASPQLSPAEAIVLKLVELTNLDLQHLPELSFALKDQIDQHMGRINQHQGQQAKVELSSAQASQLQKIIAKFLRKYEADREKYPVDFSMSNPILFLRQLQRKIEILRKASFHGRSTQ